MMNNGKLVKCYPWYILQLAWSALDTNG